MRFLGEQATSNRKLVETGLTLSELKALGTSPGRKWDMRKEGVEEKNSST